MFHALVRILASTLALPLLIVGFIYMFTSIWTAIIVTLVGYYVWSIATYEAPQPPAPTSLDDPEDYL